MTPAIINAVQQLTTNNDNVVLSLSAHSEKNNYCETNTRKYLLIFFIIVLSNNSGIKS